MKKNRSAKDRNLFYEERTEAIAAPIAAESGIRIYDVQYVVQGEEYYLNVYIDKDGGVNIGDCEAVSRLLSEALDREDLIPDAYTLIVSSPGLGRALTKDRHLRQSIGQDVEIHLYKPHSETGEKDIRGELLEFDDTRVVVSADLPVSAKGRGKGKRRKKGRAGQGAVAEAAGTAVSGKMTAAENAPEETDSEAAASPAEQQAVRTGRKRLTVGRREIASIRLAFDFE